MPHQPLFGLRSALRGPKPTSLQPLTGIEVMRGELPTSPLKGGIFPGSGGHVAPAIEALKDLYRGATQGTMKLPEVQRAIENPLAHSIVQSMQREGPEKYLTALADKLRRGQEGEGLTHRIIDSIFPVFFGH